MQIQLSSPAFQDGGQIPKQYTCDGQNISPPLEWTGVPQEAKSLVLIVDDPDAPSGAFLHWVLFNLEPGLTELPEGVTPGSLGEQAANDFRKPGYGGPCPPKGPAHSYFFKLYALDRTLSLGAGATKQDAEKAMQGSVLAQGQMIGKYGR